MQLTAIGTSRSCKGRRHQIFLAMKCLTILLLAACLQVGARSYSQTISVKFTGVTLEKALKEISRQSGYQVFYQLEQIKTAKTVSINLENTDLAIVLKEMFKDQLFSYAITNKTIVVSPKAAPESVNTLSEVVSEPPAPVDISGTVTGDDGKPLGNASIQNKKSKTSAISNSAGQFTIRAEEGDELVVSYVGFESRTIKVTRAMVSGAVKAVIVLKTSFSKLDEVAVTVSTGYQNLSRSQSPGSIVHIGQEVLANRPATDLSAALDGVVAGMQATQSSNGNNTFIIRGISTLDTANKQRLPLVVLDGFPLASSDFSTINPNDVESVDVLKDAAAAAVWGARATNGVIVITTKKGRGRQGLTIDGNMFFRVAPRPDLGQIINNATSAQTIAYEKWAVANNFYGGTAYQGGIFPSELNRTLTLAQEFLYNNVFRGYPTAAMNASLDSLASINNSNQLNQYLLRPTATQQYNIGIRYNTDRAKTYGSILYERNQDRFVGNGYEKFNINFQNEYKLSNFLTFNFNTFLLYTDQSNSGSTLSELRNLSPYETLLNPDGSYSAQINTYNRYLLSRLPLNRFPYTDLSYNLLQEVQNRNLRTRNYYARIQTGLVFKIIPGLTLDTKLQYERGIANVENYYSDNTFYVRQMVDNFTAYNNTTGVVGNSLLPKGSILQTQNNNVTNYNYRTQLNFIKNLNKFSINATAGGEISQAKTEGRSNPWQYGYNRALQTSVVPPYGYGSSVETFAASTITGGNTNSLNGGNTILSYDLDRFVSYFAASNITYNNKYTLTLNIRGDASNYITSIASLRWSPFWSIGGNWDMKAEKFMNKANWVNYLHLRASYGGTGTADKTTSTQALLNMGTAPNTGTGTVIASVSGYGNPYLRWERTYTTNLAVDFGLFNNKLNGSLNFYNKSGTDITGSVTLPVIYGVASQKFNAADLVNRGFELQLGTNLKLPGGVSYNTSLNYAYNWNRITKLYFPTQANYTLTTGGGFVEGRPVNAFYTYDYAGVNATGQPQFYGAGKVMNKMSGSIYYFLTNGLTAGYLNYAGTSTPPHTMGWRNSFTWRNLTLTALFTGTFGATFIDPTFNYGSYAGNGKTIVSSFVSQPLSGDPTYVPFPSTADIALAGGGVTYWQYYAPFLTQNVQSADYIQLKELYLNYNMPQSVLSKLRFSSLSIYAQCRDLGMIWNNNRNHYRPDFLPGTDRPLRTFTFGVKFGL